MKKLKYECKGCHEKFESSKLLPDVKKQGCPKCKSDNVVRIFDTIPEATDGFVDEDFMFAQDVNYNGGLN